MTDAAELVKLAEWIREPDFAESFTLADMADWMNRRPIGAVLKLAAQQDGSEVDQRTLDDMKLADNVRQTAIEECARVAHGLKLGWLNGDASTIYGQGYQTACEHLAAELLKLKSAPEQ